MSCECDNEPHRPWLLASEMPEAHHEGTFHLTDGIEQAAIMSCVGNNCPVEGHYLKCNFCTKYVMEREIYFSFYGSLSFSESSNGFLRHYVRQNFLDQYRDKIEDLFGTRASAFSRSIHIDEHDDVYDISFYVFKLAIYQRGGVGSKARPIPVVRGCYDCWNLIIESEEDLKVTDEEQQLVENMNNFNVDTFQ